jgi:hypothetical protein
VPATINLAQPILSRQVLTGSAGVAQVQRSQEKATQTFLQGTPVQYDVAGATGFIIACPTISSVATARIAGVSLEGGANLTTSGVPKTQNLTQKPPNQPSAVITAIGAPPNDGTTGFVVASDDNLFVGILGDSSDNTLAVLAQAMIASAGAFIGFGLTKDAGNNWWYVDNHITTAATGACVEIKQLIDPIGTLNGRVLFRFLRAVQQLNN